MLAHAQGVAAELPRVPLDVGHRAVEVPRQRLRRVVLQRRGELLERVRRPVHRDRGLAVRELGAVRLDGCAVEQPLP